MKNIWTIMSKEFTRFFTDRRMVIMTLMPAVLIYVVYSFMGTAMQSTFSPDEGHTPNVFAVYAPEDISQLAGEAGYAFTNIEITEADEIKDRLRNKDEDTDVLLIFPPDFTDLIELKLANIENGDIISPNIEMYYNGTMPNSAQAYSSLYAILDNFEASLVSLFVINAGVETADLATTEDQAASIISMMMPMLVMIFLFSGCMGLALESITGEKERGTLATLLVSPLKRSELAIGKILSLAVLSFFSGIATTIATIMSLPNLMGGADTMDTNIYGASDYALLAFVILTLLLLIVAMLSIVSAFARTVKEAGQATTPLMVLVMVVGVSGMFGSVPSEAVIYLIPMYNSVQSMSAIFSLDYDVINVIISCVSNLMYAGIGGFILTKMFNSEKVMFSK